MKSTAILAPDTAETRLDSERLPGDARVLFSLHSALIGTSNEFDQALKVLQTADRETVSKLLNNAEKTARTDLQATPSTISNIDRIARLSRQLERSSTLRNMLKIPEPDESKEPAADFNNQNRSLTDQSVLLSTCSRLHATIELALDDQSHFDQALELLKLETQHVQAHTLQHYESEQTKMLEQLGPATVSNIVEHAQAIRKLECLSSFRGHLGLPENQLLSIITAIQGKGLSLERQRISKG